MTKTNTKPLDTCFVCLKTHKEPKNRYVYQLVLKTSTTSKSYGVLYIAEKLNEWLMTKHYHLSSTQIILLRPDVFEVFLNQVFKTKFTSWGFEAVPICDECYIKYVKLIPLR